MLILKLRYTKSPSIIRRHVVKDLYSGPAEEPAADNGAIDR